MRKTYAAACAAVLVLAGAGAMTSTTSQAQTTSAPDAAAHPKARAKCHGVPATIVGNRRSNRLVGTKHGDVIVGKGGNDVIVGRGGRDLICGGRGADMLNAMQARREYLFGGHGKDFCYAPETEHRFHYGCEVHLPPPPRHHGPAGRAALAPPRRGQALTDRVGVAGKRTAQQLFAGPLTCDGGSAYAIDDDPTLISGGGAGYPDPTYVQVQRFLWSWSSQGWLYRGMYDWNNWTVQNDGGVYSLPFNRIDLTSGEWFVQYRAFWWDGARWAVYSDNPVQEYYGFSGYGLGAFGGGNVGFCSI
jgi:Ca2+-binding RTX toxin-like protein